MKILGKTIDKKWFENYWFYYRIHTIVGLFAILVTVITLVECANRIIPDVSVTYIGASYFGEDFATSFESELSPYINDVNGDNIKNIFFSSLTIGEQINSEQNYAMLQKAQLEVAAGDSYLFLFDKEHFDFYQEQGMFLDVSQYLGESEPVYGLPAENSELLRSFGIKDDANIIVGVRVLTLGHENKPKRVAQQNNAIIIFKEIFKKD